MKRGTPVSLGFVNKTLVTQNIRVHGHVVRLLHDLDDGWEPYWRNAVIVAEGRTKRVAFVADNPGKWPLVKADNPIGEWNTLHIKMIGNKVWVWLNGKLVVDGVTLENYWERDKPIYPVGQIELQNHNSHLWFKNIYIKELPASPAPGNDK